MSANPAHSMPFAKLVGVEITSATAEAIEGYLDVRDELCTTGGIIHGGAVMAFADAMGAVGAFVSLPEGAKGTTTIESKTNFLGAAKIGERVTAVAKPLSIGRRISVWQTTMTRPDGKPVAVVTQTQLVL
ncbi:PaaI family thioesterase [Citromicrobium bathyomarinum]|uniref:PaaI family thioesterase n=1 Tax=Citromicrobium TaxID=72173 RepID=UPI0002F0D0FE|nr:MULTISPECIES: PaaI family thioesterase [Citromicrobium]ALG61949.1 phenylacetic acid degradation protein [Citromicrobium sp. JL477]KPM16317.1 phenylacetic acid degradation protein [Citromicrobium sp. JL1351]KPM19221.1 phenylacetic acid degradation protein [Citromicrobium sp. JL31]KPM23956.1 phenylacetic acid degradation protein [Citromicrobium sp. JL2201]